MNRRPVRCLALVLCVAWCGCSKPGPQLPKTFPAVGKVRFVGGKPFAGGIISLTSEADATLVMEAPISDDGSFALSMMFGNQRLEGAAEGKYKVMVSSRFARATTVQTYVLKAPVAIEAKENNLVIEVDPATAQH